MSEAARLPPAAAVEESKLCLDAVPTPAFVVDRAVVARNCERMLAKAAEAGVSIRPHVKTHKTVEAAEMQLGGGRSGGIVVSTMREALFFADAGFEDILLAVPLDLELLPRVKELTERCRAFHVLLDHPAVLEAAASYAAEMAFTLSVFVKIDTGYHRCGLPPADDATVAFVRKVADGEHTTFAGIYCHSGHAYGVRSAKEGARLSDEECSSLSSFGDKLKAAGIDVAVLSVGSTPTCSAAATFDAVSEIHPGNYVFYDRQQQCAGACEESDIAVSVLTKVLSHYPDRNQIVIDAGGLAFSKDTAPAGGWGAIMGFPSLRIKSISQEVGVVVSEEAIDFDALPIGKRLRVLPNHACLTAACFPEYVVVDGGDEVVAKWKPCKWW